MKEIIFKDLISSDFEDTIRHVALRLQVDPNWLIAVMWSESRLKPNAKNRHSGAVGLIQFMPKTAVGLGTTCDRLEKMSAIGQMVFVEHYFTPYVSRIKRFTDLYMACFFPRAVGRADDYILQTSTLSASLIASQNPVFDLNKDSQITVGEFNNSLKKIYPSHVHPYLF